MFDRFRDLTEEQLNVGIAMVGALCFVMLIIMTLLNVTPVGADALGMVGLGGGTDPNLEPTPTTGTTLPPTWTPRATNTATPTVTPRPTETETPTVEVTNTSEITPTLEVTESATPDYAATISAAQSTTPVAPPVPVATATSRPVTAPAPAPVVPVVPPVAAPPVVPPTTRPDPTNTPEPTPTPLPLYVLAELLGGPNCSYSGISGTVRNNDGTPRTGVAVEVFNETGYKQSLTTDASGFYEAFLDSKPREDLKGYWHIRILEGGVQGSNEIVVIMSGNCTEGENQFVANFYRSQ